MRRFLALALLLSAVSPVPAAATPTVEVANGDWSFLPTLKLRSNAELRNIAIGTEQKCSTLATRAEATEFNISFAAHFDPNGTPTKVVMPKLDCPEVESILGGVLLEMVEKGDYRPDGSNADGWYKGTLSFTVS